MKTRYKILIIFTFVVLLLIIAMSIFMFEMHGFVAHYETWGYNDKWYFHPAGYKVECEKRFLDTPGACQAIDEHGVVVATKTNMQNWTYNRIPEE